MGPDGLLPGKPRVLLVAVRDPPGRLVADAQRGDQGRVAVVVLLVQVVQQAAAFVDHGDQAAAGGEVLGVPLQVAGQVVDAFRHAGHLELRRAGVFVVPPVRRPKLLDAEVGGVPGGGLPVVFRAVVVVLLQVADADDVILLRRGVNVRQH